ncbi:hypothetical protein B0H13DRAFT_2021985 [Mycena leptocephala]|nr:hypothetical protein B0H13DRAFT_2021985 [Mycena leptocephala]
MSAGTTVVYKLDLDDIAAFPDTAHVSRLPPKPGESWIVLGEILDGDPNPLSSHPLISPFFLVRDKMDYIFSVALSRLNSTGWQAATAAACKIGHVLCISSGVREHLFGDSEEAGTASGSLMYKYVIEDPSTLFVLPCSMAQLHALNRRLRDKSEAGEMELCNACKKPSTQRCSRCETSYCSQECQAADWKQGGHRKECPVIARLHIWNRTDWGNSAEPSSS